MAPGSEGHTGKNPRGEGFAVLGRAGAVRLERPTDAAGELLIVKAGRTFLCSRMDGDIYPGGGEGLYFDDTRFLSVLTMTLGGKPPSLLTSSNGLGYLASIEATSPSLGGVPRMTLGIRRSRLVEEEVLHERIELHNFGSRRVVTDLQLRLEADFADIFEVRGVGSRSQRGEALVPKRSERGATFGYVGEDQRLRRTIVETTSGSRWQIEDAAARASWQVRLEPGEEISLDVTIRPAYEDDPPKADGFEPARKRVAQQRAARMEHVTRIHTDNELFDRVTTAAARDISVLDTPFEEGRVVAAGIPWYVAPFGRDALITAYETLMLDPSLAREALLFLAARQARTDDPNTDAEPGKILHEIRQGELARCGLVPHMPYYGTADATPLFLILAAQYHRWTDDMETLEALLPAIDGCIWWIEGYADLDGDGFLECSCRAPGGLPNQGWKDSRDAIVHADGTPAGGPIALSEVQGYAYMAKMLTADLFRSLGREAGAAKLVAEAGALKDAYEEAFWMPDEGFYAMALDGDKRQVAAISSNPGQGLFCGIVSPERAGAVVERLMAPDMFSGWGIRTLSSAAAAYDPRSYHRGSVWPHDNAIIAAGFKRYGFHLEVETIATSLFDGAKVSREASLPELFCGFPREEGRPYVAYPVACRPQAWAAGATFLLLQAMLGLEPNATEGRLISASPSLPEWLGRVDIENISFRGKRVSVAFRRDGHHTSFRVSEPPHDVMSGRRR